MIRRLFPFLLFGLVLAACQPSAPPSTPVPTAPPTDIPPAPVIIVTLDTRSGAFPNAPSALDLGPYLGPWELGIDVRLDGGAVIDQIRFLGGATVTVQADGSLRGYGTLATAVSHPGCRAAVQDDGAIGFAVSGQVGLGPNGVEMTFTMEPDNPARLEHYRLECAAFSVPVLFEQRTLWPALSALGLRSYTLPMQPGVSLRASGDVTAATGRALQGQLILDIRLTR